jgi:predicted outer membrane repeat protein
VPVDAAVVSQCASDTQGGAGAANFETAMAAGGTITFQCPAGAVIVLNRTYVVTRDTAIDGGNRMTLDGGDHIMFQVRNNASLRFSDIVIRNGNETHDTAGALLPDVQGGVVGGDGRVELLRATVTDSDGAFWLRTGSIRIRASRIEDNRRITVHAPIIDIDQGTRFTGNTGTPVHSSGGTVSIDDSEFVGNGTSTFTGCTLTIKRSTFNAHVNSGNGGALHVDCNATIERSEFHNNRATNGGAVYIGGEPATVLMRRVTFAGNIADETGGAIGVETSFTRALTLTIRNGTFERNRARSGGAIMLEFFGNTRLLQGSAVRFSGNIATNRGGAIYSVNAGIRIARGVFIGNVAPDGGGAVFALQQGTHTSEFANSLFTHNRSTQGGSAFQGAAAGFSSTTIDANEGVAVVAVAPPPVAPPNTPPVFPIRFANTIVSGPLPPCGPSVATAPFTHVGHSIQYPGVSCGTTIPSVHPGLGPFFVPMPWSPALNAGDNAVCQSAPVSGRDLYNVKRPLMTSCATGAVEGDLPRIVSTWLRERDELVGEFRNALGLRRQERNRPR